MIRPSSFRKSHSWNRQSFNKKCEGTAKRQSPAGHGECGYSSGTGTFQHFGAFMGGGSGGEDIIHQQNPEATYRIPTAKRPLESEGIAQIFEACVAVQMGLGRRVAHSPQAISDWPTRDFSQDGGDFCGLIKLALTEATGMQRHRNKRPVGMFLQSRFIAGM